MKYWQERFTQQSFQLLYLSLLLELLDERLPKRIDKQLQGFSDRSKVFQDDPDKLPQRVFLRLNK
jgi:hypothetical protein